MTKCSKEEHKELRDRLNPVVKDEFVSASKTNYQAKNRKERLDRINHLEELAKLEADFINNYD